MSTEKHEFEARRWISQAADDLDAAGVLLDGEKYAQACFYAQQSAEKALKGVGWANGLELWGHSLIKLREQLQAHDVRIGGLEREDMSLLDKFYIPTRYPNGLPEIIPQEGYGPNEATGGIAAARRVVEWSEAHA